MENTKYNGSEKEIKKRRLTVWTRRSLLEKVLLVAVAALFLILIIIVIVSIHSALRKRNIEPKICMSPACIKQTAFLYENLDTTSKPCNDFYQFACGSYKKHHALGNENSHHNAMDDIQDSIFLSIKNLLETPEESEDRNLEQAKNFYYACTNKKVEGTRNAVVMLLRTSGLGEWPISDRGRNPNFHIKLGVLSAHGRNPFFETTIKSQSPEIQIRVYPWDDKMTQLKDEYYFNDNTFLHTEEKSAYHKFILNSLVQMGVQPDVARRDASDLMEFEANLVNITKQLHDSTTIETTLDKMEEIFPGLNWETWFRKTFGFGINIQDDVGGTSVIVSEPERLKRIFKLIKSVEESVVDNYLMWRFVIDLLPLLDTSFRRSYKTILPYVKDDRNYQYRKREYFFDEWKQCVHITSEVFRMPVTVAFINNSVRADIRSEIVTIVEYLKDVFKEVLISQNWLEKDSKMFLRSKMENMIIEIVNSENMDDPVFKVFMRSLNIREDDFVDALLQVERSFFLLTASPSLVQHTKPLMSPFLEYPPLSPMIKYSIAHNILAISAGMLLTDIDNIDSPKSLIFGGLGTSLARSMYFAYHENLYQESKEISDKDIISKKDEYKYKEKMRCFKGQQIMYSSYSSMQKANKSTILKDMISYDVGLKSAYSAYKDYLLEHKKDTSLPEIHLSNEQLFFLRFAQTMCEIRNKKNLGQDTVSLNEILYNSEEFSRAYHCPPGSVMNPNDKCAIWD